MITAVYSHISCRHKQLAWIAFGVNNDLNQVEKNENSNKV